ncbi:MULTISPECIES: alpha/beta hydrolase [unclassified Rhodococcus (in: high G+C Gram-positive bacteria)]|uniref:alpha/beta hydrolase n=1 Tax=unclassified Rhodococcus (in: high G+C Gram-positive bacteria) TaxID=192944 RepID=UPI001F0E9350|nr:MULTISPECIES: alpha/beta hydrolase family protein [unclassified Rhodococcus (in: high G+C Gram-positive bacteria)]
MADESTREVGRVISALFRRAIATVGIGVLVLLGAPGIASAEPVSHLSRVEVKSDRVVVAHVYSAAMDREVALRVYTPADTSVPSPTLYLLNGASGGQGVATWDARTNMDEFFADKNVNVVTPLDGSFTYYTDWLEDDPILGRNKWTTFLTRELPPIIDAEFGTTGTNAIAGLSMSGTSVLSLAIAEPTLYKAVGAYSGCAETSTELGQLYVRAVVESRGEANAENMWGPYGGPGWVQNDPFVNAEKLRGIDLYISSATGLPGEHDRLGSTWVGDDPGLLANQVVVGGVIEAAVDNCTRRLAARLEELEIPAVFDFRPAGTHSWGYWQDDLHNSWPMLANALEVS